MGTALRAFATLRLLVSPPYRVSADSRSVSEAMSRRIDKSWVVFESVENQDHNRCVDLFRRPDGTWGFEEFRRDVEDAGAWMPVAYYSAATYASREAAWKDAVEAVPWLVTDR